MQYHETIIWHKQTTQNDSHLIRIPHIYTVQLNRIKWKTIRHKIKQLVLLWRILVKSFFLDKYWAASFRSINRSMKRNLIYDAISYGGGFAYSTEPRMYLDDLCNVVNCSLWGKNCTTAEGNLAEAWHMECGVLEVGLGSTVIGWTQLQTDLQEMATPSVSANVSLLRKWIFISNCKYNYMTVLFTTYNSNVCESCRHWLAVM